MSKNEFKPNRAGIQDILLSEGVRELINTMGEEVAASVAGEVKYRSNGGQVEHGVPVKHGSYTTDRAAYSVTLAHPAGIPLEAKYGYLMKAAQSAGFERGRKSLYVTASGTRRMASARQIAHWSRGK